MAPVTQYFARLPKALELTTASPDHTPIAGFQSPTNEAVRNAVYSPDGSYLAYALLEGVKLIDPDTGAEVRTIDVPEVVDLSFSPRAGYVLTWQRPKKDEVSGNFHPNLKVWTIGGDLVQSFVQKAQGGWMVQYTADEKYCVVRSTATTLLVYESAKLSAPPVATLKLDEPVAEFQVSPGQNYTVAVFIPEANGRPAAVRVYTMPNFGQPLSQKTFFKADKVQMQWNRLGTSLLVLSSTDVDTSGKSYYGETNLYLLGIAGSYDSRVHLDKEGTIHGFAWSPNSREFGVVYGYMPAKASIFDARGNEIHSFPVAARNTIMFSPHARFILLAGFGNLSGSVDIYDRQKQFSKVCTIDATNTSYCAWSPDGRHLLTATTSPRLRVDNGIRIWHCSGSLMYVKDHTELLGVAWRPQPIDLFPMRASVSPPPAPHASAATSKMAPKPVDETKPTGAYRPPHARISGVTVAPTSLYEHTQAKLNAISLKTTVGRTVPGAAPAAIPAVAAPLSKAAAKNKKKREAAKVKAETEVEEPVVSLPQTPAEPVQPPAANAPTGSSLEDKKIRSLLKKLRAIEDLRQKQALGLKLEDTQVQKIGTEPAVRKELLSLGWTE